MTRTTLQTILVAGMVLLAGCAGGLSGSPTAAPGDGADGTADGAGTVAFYISDQPNAIEDFEHLNVTISQVGFQQAGDDAENETEADAENETEADAENETEADAENETEADAENEPDTAAGDERPESEADEGDESGGWIEHDVDDRTVDLTALVGDNATMLAEYDVPNGSYTKVFVHVSEVNATLESGETVNVKLPSDKLQLTTPFEVGNGESVDFVFDIAVHKAGNSGKYILRPVIGESGTGVPIERVDDAGEREADADDEREADVGDGREDAAEDRRDDAALNASFVGEVVPGENATVAVSNGSGPVAGATVRANGERLGETAENGRLRVAIPDDEELEIAVRYGDAEAELEREFEADGGAGTPAQTAS